MDPVLIDAAKAFNIQFTNPGDPLIDQSSQLRAAFASMGDAETGENFAFPPGIFAAADLDPLKVSVTGSGVRRTTFANLSTTTRLFEMQPNQGPGWSGMGSAFQGVEGVTIDQRFCSGSAIKLSTQFNFIHDVAVRDQGGGRAGQAAIHVENGTLCDLRNVHVLNSDNCMRLLDTHYVRGFNISLERQDGRALRALNCPRVLINGLYTDNGNTRSVGKTVPEVSFVENCNSFRVFGWDQELAPSGNLDALQGTNDGVKRAFNRFLNCMNVYLQGVAVSHSTNNPSSFMFFFENGGATMSGVEWNEKKNAMVLASGCGDIKRLIVEKVDAYNIATGSRWGVGMWYGKPAGAIIAARDWADHGQPVSHQL